MNIKIAGNSSQYLEVEMPPSEYFIAKSGSLTYYEDGISVDVKILRNGFRGLIYGIFSTNFNSFVHYTNKNNIQKKLVLSSNSNLIPIRLTDFPNQILCSNSSFFASTKNINVTYRPEKRLFSNNKTNYKISGIGTVFLTGRGEIKQIKLNGNKLIVESAAILAFEENLILNCVSDPSRKWYLGGYYTIEEVSGFGTIWIQSFNELSNSNPFLSFFNGIHPILFNVFVILIFVILILL